LSNTTGTIVGALTGLAALGSVYVYWRKRQTIPKLSFEGYWKTDSLFVTEHVETKVISYCVRIEDINPKSEGKIRSCAGSATVNNDISKTIWMFANKRNHDFVKEAWLKLFDVDWKDDTIGLFDTSGKTDAKRFPVAYGRRNNDNITINLESARGRRPDPVTEKIEYIIKKARYF
jgi:hypothetical protein